MAECTENLALLIKNLGVHCNMVVEPCNKPKHQITWGIWSESHDLAFCHDCACAWLQKSGTIV